MDKDYQSISAWRITKDFARHNIRFWNKRREYSDKIALEAELIYADKLKTVLNYENDLTQFEDMRIFQKYPNLFGISKNKFLKRLLSLLKFTKQLKIEESNHTNLNKYFNRFSPDEINKVSFLEITDTMAKFICTLIKPESWSENSKWLLKNGNEMIIRFSELLNLESIDLNTPYLKHKRRKLLPEIFITLSYFIFQLIEKPMPDDVDQCYIGTGIVALLDNTIYLTDYLTENMDMVENEFIDSDKCYIINLAIYCECFILEYILSIQDRLSTIGDNLLRAAIDSIINQLLDKNEDSKKLQLDILTELIYIIVNINANKFDKITTDIDLRFKVFVRIHDQLINVNFTQQENRVNLMSIIHMLRGAVRNYRKTCSKRQAPSKFESQDRKPN